MSSSINLGANFLMNTKYGQMEYAKYIQRIIEDKDNDLLNSFGVYVQGMENDMVSVEMKCILLLESILEDPETYDAFEKTSSSVLIEHMQSLLDKFREEEHSVAELHQELVELLYDYLDGC